MRKIRVAATQMSCTWSIEANIRKADHLVRLAASQQANIILLQELFETPYFCQKENPEHFQYATELEHSKAVAHFRKLAQELKVVLPISFYEKRNKAKYNSVVVIDADGHILGTYRKTHVPEGPGCEEKYYFNPGDTGFRVWQTRYAKIGVGICWDQWYPEAARIMALQGAELLLYPAAIGAVEGGSEEDKNHWQICMQGHAAANMIPVVVSNRVGTEAMDDAQTSFYGSSFITDCMGQKINEADQQAETVLVCSLNLDEIERKRSARGVFRDRRPDMYRSLLTQDGYQKIE